MKRILSIELFFAIGAIVIVISLLFIKPFIGVADNGDFLRVMGSIGLNYYPLEEDYADRFFNYAHAAFAYDSFFRGFYTSTQLLLVVIARWIGQLIDGTLFPIRTLAVIYSGLLVTAGCLLIGYSKAKSVLAAIVLAALLLFVFFDIGYIAYFNSLYGEPVSLVFLLLTVGLGLRLAAQERPTKLLLLLFFAAVIFFSCSKTQNAPVGIAFALIGLRFGWMKEGRQWRKLTIMLAAVTCLASIITYMAAPSQFKQINQYQTVFFGILKDSPHVSKDLEELGLPEHLSVLAGTNYFQTATAIKQDAPSMKEDFYDRISHLDVLFFYLNHPTRLVDKLEYAAQHSMMIRPYYLGNYEKSEGKSPGAMSFAYSIWSEFKKKYVPNSLWFIAACYIVYYIIALLEWGRAHRLRSKIASELFMLIGLTGLFSFLIPILGDGQADLAKHLFLFNVAFDMMLVSAVVWLVVRLNGLWRPASPFS